VRRSEYRCGWSIESSLKRTVRRDGHKIKLRAKEFALLEFFMRNADRVVDRMTITQKVWTSTTSPRTNVIDVYVSSLRKKIDRDFERPLIHNGSRHGVPVRRAGVAVSRTGQDQAAARALPALQAHGLVRAGLSASCRRRWSAAS
jgi:DNA-binding winged helix-turn-helix (wHTH) protein